MCKSARIERRERLIKIVQDIKFSDTGIKRWNVRYIFNRYSVVIVVQHSCFGKAVDSEQIRQRTRAFAIYLVIDLFCRNTRLPKSLK